MWMRQLFDEDTYTFTYLIVDEGSSKAALIDPVLGQVDRDLQLIQDLGLTLTHVLDTHVHADHVTGAGKLRERSNATYVASPLGAECADVRAQHGMALQLGATNITVLATPGHTDDSLSFVIGNNVFTGDALFVRGCGRTDFQNGDAATLYASITEQLFALPDHTQVWPGHDYRGHTVTTVGEEKRLNPRISQRTKEEFMTIMSNLTLPRPKYLDIAVPANRECGLGTAAGEQPQGGFADIPASEALAYAQEHSAVLLDVREPQEYVGELGHIPGALNVPWGELAKATQELEFDSPIVVVCRSGRRSRAACQTLVQRGFRNIVNMKGGMLEYREQQG